jgi:hypothetical protein
VCSCELRAAYVVHRKIKAIIASGVTLGPISVPSDAVQAAAVDLLSDDVVPHHYPGAAGAAAVTSDGRRADDGSERVDDGAGGIDGVDGIQTDRDPGVGDADIAHSGGGGAGASADGGAGGANATVDPAPPLFAVMV